MGSLPDVLFTFLIIQLHTLFFAAIETKSGYWRSKSRIDSLERPRRALDIFSGPQFICPPLALLERDRSPVLTSQLLCSLRFVPQIDLCREKDKRNVSVVVTNFGNPPNTIKGDGGGDFETGKGKEHVRDMQVGGAGRRRP
ncbi:hypothetical protein C8R45DRAFT_927196 [Mycena sanguinolenta]|nr:hypothetical protein C8R45DRAFT_927196 [Mycena sanguinolenta]